MGAMSRAVAVSVLFWLFAEGGPAAAQCGDWLRQVALPKLGCSPQAIEDICAGRRPVPTGGNCAAPGPPAPPAAGPPYEQFRALAAASGIDLRLHPTYTEAYFERRARLFCSLLQAGEMVKLSTEITFPPVVDWSETTNDRPRLEVAVLRVGTAAFCAEMVPLERQWEATNVR